MTPLPRRYGGLLDFSPESVMNQAQFPGGVIPLPQQPFPSAAKVKGPSFAERASNFLMPAPDGMQEAGLLTDDDIKNAQRQGFLGLGASLLSNSGPKLAQDYVSPFAALGQGIQAMQGTHKGALDSAMALRAGKEEFVAQKRKNQTAAGIETGRAAIIKKYPMPDTADLNAMEQWIGKVMPHFIEISDEETVGRLSGIYESIQNSRPKPGQAQREPGDWVTVPGPDGKPMRRYVTASEAGQSGVPEYEKQGELTPYQQIRLDQLSITNEQSLYNDFQQDTKKASTATFVLNDTLREADRAIAGEVASQTRMLYGFINSMDDTAVREGEQKLVQKAAPLVAQAEAALSKLNYDKSYSVPKPMLEQMKALMQRRFAGNKSYLSSQETKYQSIAKRYKADPSRFTVVIPDYTQDGSGDVGGAPTTPSAVPQRLPGESWSDYLKRTK